MLVVLRGRSKVLMPPSLPHKMGFKSIRRLPSPFQEPSLVFRRYPLYSWVDRGTGTVKCFAQVQHNLELLVQHTMHKATRSPVVKCLAAFDPFHPKTSMHILYTVPYTFPEVLMRRICFIIINFSSW